MVENRFIWSFGMLAGLVLIGFGAVFFVAPDAGLSLTHHEAASLPLVMGGRYVFLGGLLIAALLHGSPLVLVGLCAGFAWLAFVDAAIYWQVDPIPHVAVGVISAAAAFYFFSKRKADA